MADIYEPVFTNNGVPIGEQHDNPKFAMRTWLNRLGLIGAEFATAREFLTKNLSGNAAWRFAA